MTGPAPFEKVIRCEIPADFVCEDELRIAFRDVGPQAPAHALIVPCSPLGRACR